ncbi:hypothetical protein [Lacticaseibacillus zhaodongensis]|uniref:hypothetical protein n=1 Tax=Lacticaseibacillus zhaodongensis TaxID=2668065 RepID=UPI0012D2A809|nr:hypothetical protein [Lacticaseibacillus zhaodongensis]
MKRDKKRDDTTVLDMNLTLVANAERKLADHRAAAGAVAKALANGTAGLTDLFKDDGKAQKDYEAIAEGYLRDAYNIDGSQLERETQALVKQAVQELRSHPEHFANH